MKESFPMLKLSEVRDRLAGAHIPAIQRATGLSYNCINDALKNPNKDPRYSTYERLAEIAIDPAAVSSKKRAAPGAPRSD